MPGSVDRGAGRMTAEDARGWRGLLTSLAGGLMLMGGGLAMVGPAWGLLGLWGGFVPWLAGWLSVRRVLVEAEPTDPGDGLVPRVVAALAGLWSVPMAVAMLPAARVEDLEGVAVVAILSVLVIAILLLGLACEAQRS